MSRKLSENIREWWSSAEALLSKLLIDSEFQGFRIPDSAVPEGYRAIFTAQSLSDDALFGAANADDLFVVRLVDDEGKGDIDRGNTFHASMFIRPRLLHHDRRDQLRRATIHNLISFADTIARHGDGIIRSPLHRTPVSIDEFEDLWSLPETARPSIIAATASTVDAAVFDLLRSEPELLYALKPREFEELVAEILNKKGFKTYLTPQSRDGGLDIIAERRDDQGLTKLVVECKRYTPPNNVGIEIVQRLFGVQEAIKATRGIVATSSFFAGPAAKFAKDHESRLTLWDYYDIKNLLNERR